MLKKLPLLIFLFLFPFFCWGKEKISAFLEFPEKIKADEEFEVLVKIFGLENEKYDLKLTLKKEKEISEIYNFSFSKWQKSLYYLKNEVSGPIFQKKYKLRLSENFLSLEGRAELILKLRKGKKVLFEKKETLEIEKTEEKKLKNKEYLARKKIDLQKEINSNLLEKIEWSKNWLVLSLEFFLFAGVLIFLIKNHFKR